MIPSFRTIAILVSAAPLPVLIHLGLRDETGAITAAGAGFSFGLAIMIGLALSRMLKGLLRLPFILLAIGLAVAAIGFAA